MVFSGGLLKIFPIANDAQNTWLSPADITELPTPSADWWNKFKILWNGLSMHVPEMWTRRHQKYDPITGSVPVQTTWRYFAIKIKNFG